MRRHTETKARNNENIAQYLGQDGREKVLTVAYKDNERGTNFPPAVDRLKTTSKDK